MRGAHQFTPLDEQMSSEGEFFSELFYSSIFGTADQNTAGTVVARVDAGEEEIGIAEEAAKSLGASVRAAKRIEEEASGSCDHQQKKKRNRTTEMHNMTERKRRDKIKGKLKALQEIIPNSHKLDKASLLDQTIAYVKSLQMQVQNITGGGLGHASCMPPSPGACLHMPHFSPFMIMGMGYGMGMGSMGCNMCPSLVSIPLSTHPPTSYISMPGFNSIPSFYPTTLGVQFPPTPEYAASMSTAIPSPPILHAEPFSSYRQEAGSHEILATQLIKVG